MSAFIFAGGDPSKVDVSGYSKGDVLAADTTGVLQPVTVGPDGEVLTADHLATEGVDWQAGGGGGGASPGNTVVTEQAFGQASTAGALLTYSRSDHTHGTPAAPAVPSASGTVVAELTFGQSSTAGVAGTFSRGDHTHGTPPAPRTVRVASTGWITTGNVTVTAGLPFTVIAPAVGITAVAGDWLGVSIRAITANSGAPEFIADVATRVLGVDVHYFSTGTTSPLFPGSIPQFLAIGSGTFEILSAEVMYQVVSGDIDAGTVTLQAYAAADGGGNRDVFANATFPLRVDVKNYGPGT